MPRTDERIRRNNKGVAMENSGWPVMLRPLVFHLYLWPCFHTVLGSAWVSQSWHFIFIFYFFQCWHFKAVSPCSCTQFCFMCWIDGGIPFQISEDKEPPLDSSCWFFKDGNLINLDYGPSRASVVLWALSRFVVNYRLITRKSGAMKRLLIRN